MSARLHPASAYKPHIFGKVLTSTTVPIHAFIICDSNGVAAVSENTVADWIAEANRIYRQVAMTFTLASVSSVTNQSWFNIDSDVRFYQMTSYTNYTGGLELYCVKSINGLLGKSTTPATSGETEGLMVSSEAFLNTLAHEIGHSCGLMHVDTTGYGDGLVAEDLVESPNWSGGSGTGYYEPTLKYRDLTPRIIMSTSGGESRAEIPLYGVQGMYQGALYLMSVGLEQMTTREPEH